MLSTLLLLTLIGAQTPEPTQPEPTVRPVERLGAPPSLTLGVPLRLGPAIRLGGERGGFLMGRGNVPMHRSREADARVSCPIQTLRVDPVGDRPAIRVVDPAADGGIVRDDIASCLK